MSQTVLVCSKLPNALLLRLPQHTKDDPAEVTIEGMNSSKIIGATFMSTPVDKEFWDKWYAVNHQFKPLKAGALWVAHTHEEAEGEGRDREKEKTGLEQLDPTDKKHKIKNSTSED
jgi:hypothetical protein